MTRPPWAGALLLPLAAAAVAVVLSSCCHGASAAAASFGDNFEITGVEDHVKTSADGQTWYLYLYNKTGERRKRLGHERTSACEADEEKGRYGPGEQIKETRIQKDAATFSTAGSKPQPRHLRRPETEVHSGGAMGVISVSGTSMYHVHEWRGD
ncbi:unnamed protein product [Miscanthus lutarioriparius]|uniref:Uncharacterized protein n=1 Tax=Miscanthus lutarioriparius TaxID=422564 RepID=A0A811NME9_9POAL|nr:unnamed protein product [Miscanthus lutarioriparius]